MPQSFNVQEDPVTVFKRAMEGRFDPSALRGLRESRQREMERNLELENESRQGTFDRQRERTLQSPSERRRDEMMGWGAAPTFESGATHADARQLQEDLDTDPDTGVLEQQRTDRINRTLQDAATTQREEVGDAIDVGSRRNAFAKFLDAQGTTSGKYAADVSDEGVEALDAASRRKATELGVAATAKRGVLGGVPLAALKPGDDPLDGLSPQHQALVKGLIDYTTPYPGNSAMRTPEWMDLAGRAKLLDPTFDASNYPAREAMRKDKVFQNNVTSLGTLREHADSLHEKGKQLGNYGGVLTPLNAVRNFFKRHTGDPDITGYGIDATVVGDEAARALKGGVPTQAESEHWRGLLDPNLSQPAQDEANRAINELASKRLGEAEQLYDSKMGKPGAFKAYLEKTKGKAEAKGGDAPETKVFTSGPYAGRTGIKQPDGTWEIQ
jgi:hypothetical protein